MLGPIETVTVKTVFSRSAAAVLPPRRGAPAAARGRGPRGAPGKARGSSSRWPLEKPYRVRFCLRRSFTEDDWVRETVGRLKA